MAGSNDYNIKSIREQFRKAGVFYTPPELAERMAKAVTALSTATTAG